jgi:5-methylcytosine-specific restriction enzyme subunit McrC
VATIQVREHENLKIGSRDPLHKVLSEDQAHALKELEATLPKGVMRWGHRSVKFRQYCGVIALGADSIEILPKIHGRETDPGISRQILVKMLYAARELTPSLHGAANIDLQKHHLLDVFINHFCGLLYEQIHKGLVKVYVENEANLPVVRGRMLVGRQFKVNLAHNERVFCVYDELQEDNAYNQAIKATLRLLYSVARASRLRQKLTELLFIFDDIQDLRVTASDVRGLPRNRLVSRYEEIFRLCEWFLSGVSPDVVVGKNPAVALLFDMNRVFEAFIASRMRKVVQGFGNKLRAQGPQRYLGEEQDSQKKLFLLRPDMSVLDCGGQIVFIADTKWKLLDASDSKYGVSQTDIYQMLAYGTQYNCQRLALVYPAHSDLGEEVPTIVIRRGGYRVEVWKIDVAGLGGIGPSVESQLQMNMMEGEVSEELGGQ